MKLIIAIIRDKDANSAIDGLVEKKIGVTKLASTGGFLQDGNTTLLIGAGDEQVEEVMEVLKARCAKRTQVELVAPHSTGGIPVWHLGYTPIKVEAGGATVFVLDVADFRKL